MSVGEERQLGRIQMGAHMVPGARAGGPRRRVGKVGEGDRSWMGGPPPPPNDSQLWPHVPVAWRAFTKHRRLGPVPGDLHFIGDRSQSWCIFKNISIISFSLIG